MKFPPQILKQFPLGCQSRRLSTVPLQLIKELRARSGAPITAVKLALQEENGDLQAAFDRLRRMGAKVASSRATRVATDGLVAVLCDDDARKVALVEVNCETDFVSRTTDFQNLVARLTTSAIEDYRKMQPHSGTEKHSMIRIPSAELGTVAGNDVLLAEAAAKFGENIQIGEAAIVQGDGIGFYVHGAIQDPTHLPENVDHRVRCGRIGVAVALRELDNTGVSDPMIVRTVASQLAMHIAADAPLYVRRDRVPSDVIAKELQIMKDAAQADLKQEGKAPRDDAILDKIAEGRLSKWLNTVVLEEQAILTADDLQTGKGKALTVGKWLELSKISMEIDTFARLAIKS